MTDALTLAAEAKEAGYSLVLTRPGEKAALQKEWQRRAPLTVAELSYSIRQGMGWAIRTVPPVVVLDLDGEEARRWAEERSIESPMTVRTRKGLHVYTRLADGVTDVRTRIRILDLPLDALAGSSRYAMGPGSRVGDWTYELVGRIVPPSELPLCPAEIVVELTRPAVETTRASVARAVHPSRRAVRNPEAYCLRIPSVKGQNGSGALVRCIAILRDAGRTRDEILAYLTNVWNPACARPPWSPEELLRAVERHVE